MLWLCTGVDDNSDAYVTRSCSREPGERVARCVPEPYGGTLQCFCSTDYCNGRRTDDASRGGGAASLMTAAARLTALHYAICCLVLLMMTLTEFNLIFNYYYLNAILRHFNDRL